MRFSTALVVAAQAAGVLAASVPRALAFDDVVVLGQDGSTKVIKDYEYTELQRRAREANREMLARVARSVKTDGTTKGGAVRTKRDCEESTEVQVLTDDTFLNWDVAMSPIVSALGGTSLVSVAQGYSIANSVTETISATATLETVLMLSYSLAYGITWTTTQTSTFTFTVPNGQYGIIVSEPSVRRLTGYTLSGCTDSPDTEAFVSDTYTPQAFGDMEWPTGVIRLCNSSSYPIPFCIGNGHHS